MTTPAKPMRAPAKSKRAPTAEMAGDAAPSTVLSADQAAEPAQNAPIKASARAEAPSAKRASAAKSDSKPAKSTTPPAPPAPTKAKSSTAQPKLAKSVAEKPATPAAKPSEAKAQPSPAAKAPSTNAASPSASASGRSGASPEQGAAAMPDFDALAQNMARLVEESGKAVAAYVECQEQGGGPPQFADDVEQAIKSIGRVAEYWLADPARTVQAQTALAGQFIDLWAQTLRRLSGEELPPVVPSQPSDKRFADVEWTRNPIFDFLRQAYVITSNWAGVLAEKAETLDPHVREKAQFYVRQVASALAPSNFLATNPELLRETFRQSGENLVRGMKMLGEDIKAGRGSIKIRQSDNSKFQLGVNLATTPGKVVFRNDLIELIQYAPTTPTVYKRPLLIVPPWINKFYILDLNPEKSFIRWAVSQGLTVFVISWVNPDERHADKDFAAYMREGVFAALDVVEEVTGERQVTAIGYCVGGTLLSVSLAYMAAKGDDRINSATLFTTQVDFRDPGELKIFVDEEQLQAIERKMDAQGYLDGSKMASAFNMLRPNDLIWSYWVNNYLKGKEPMPFDLLVWNSDSTRMPRANHKFYLRNCYLENNLTKGKMTLENVTLDLSRVKIPIYDLAAKEDHIAPAKSVFVGAQYFGGPVRYVLAGSGHIAGVVNPADKPKYQYWIGGPPKGDFDAWTAMATEHPGTWWLDWIKWIDQQAPERVPAREPGSKKRPPIGDAPGEYVRVRV
jgi:polyhydroxyalkanoate synthase